MTLLTTLIHKDLPEITSDPHACQVNIHFDTDPQGGLLELAPELKLCVILVHHNLTYHEAHLLLVITVIQHLTHKDTYHYMIFSIADRYNKCDQCHENFAYKMALYIIT